MLEMPALRQGYPSIIDQQIVINSLSREFLTYMENFVKAQTEPFHADILSIG